MKWRRAMVVSWQLVLALLIFLALAISASAAIGTDAPTPEALQQRVIELYHAGKHADAIPFAMETLERSRAVAGEKHADTAASLSWLALLYVVQRDYAKAETAYRRLVVIMEEVLGAKHPDVAIALDTLAMLYQVQDKNSEAEKLWRRAVEIKEKFELTGAHNFPYNSMHWTAFFEAQNRLSTIEPKDKYGLTWDQSLMADLPDDLGLAVSLNNLAESLDWRRNAEGAVLYQRALRLEERTRGNDSLRLIAILNNISQFYCNSLSNKPDFVEAEKLYRRALDIRKKVFGPVHLDVAKSLEHLAQCYIQQRRGADVASTYSLALAIHEKAYGAESLAFADGLDAVAGIFQGNPYQAIDAPYAESDTLYKRALAIREKVLGRDSAEVAASNYKLGINAFRWSHFTEAEAYFNDALAIREKLLGREHLDLVEIIVYLGWACKAQKNSFQKAEAYLKRALDIREKKLGWEHPKVADSLETLAEIYDVQSRSEEAMAVALLNRADKIYEKSYPPESLDLATGLASIALSHDRRHRYALAEVHAYHRSGAALASGTSRTCA